MTGKKAGNDNKKGRNDAPFVTLSGSEGSSGDRARDYAYCAFSSVTAGLDYLMV